MKLSSLALILCLGVKLAPALPETVGSFAVGIRSAETCGDPSDAVPFYRAYDSVSIDHYYTPSVASVNNVVASGSWVLQGIAALVFITQEESTVPLYHLANGAIGDNFYTISTAERDAALQNGYILDPPPPDPVTYIYPTQICGSTPFYRLFSAAGQDNFYTTSESERFDFIANRGYADVEIAGYVLALEAVQCS